MGDLMDDILTPCVLYPSELLLDVESDLEAGV